MKTIKGFEDYKISKNGDVYSSKTNKYLIAWKDSNGRYLYVSLVKNGNKKNKSVHRLVAEAYLDNPLNLPEVNHKDRNCKNNVVSNLEWCTRKYNMNHMYETDTPIRNFTECKLFVNCKLINTFKSINDAAKYASNKYNCSKSSLIKYHKSKGISIEV